jgi:tRNA pseudouridine55 synthase
MHGILLVDKPKDWTSFDVVNFVRKIVATTLGTKPKNTKVGHCGTLDPLATGLLILVIGKEYTRRASEFSKLDKTYEVTMKLGQTSITGDDEGEKVTVSDVVPSLAAVEQALKRFSGEIMQVPPQFSAMKVNGQRAYKLAREGKQVKLEARPVTIYQNELTSYEYPIVVFTSHVSTGTYIRSLVEDIGAELGTGAYMSDLRRSSINSWNVVDAVSLRDLSAEKIQKELINL